MFVGVTHHLKVLGNGTLAVCCYERSVSGTFRARPSGKFYLLLSAGRKAAFLTPCLTLAFPFCLSADSKPEEQQVSCETLRESLKKELEFYFSR